MQRESFLRVPRFGLVLEKKGFLLVDQFWHYKALNQYSNTQKIQFSSWETEKKIYNKQH